MPGHNKQEMCTTLWQAKQKKRLTRQTDGWRRGTLTQLDTARLSACSAPVWAPAPVLVLPLSLCPGIIARTACLFVCPCICLPVSLSVCNICRGTAGSSAPAGLALCAWHNCNNRIRSTFPLSARQFLCASLSPCVSLSLLAGGCLRLCGCTQSTLWLIVITPA